jgi:hypothetical protein
VAAYGYYAILADGDSVFVTAPQYPNSIVDNQTFLPNNLKLSGCYPNPFNSSTNIEFELAVESNISLDIFDICGRKIANVAKGQYSAGKYSVLWDASTRVSGVYFIRLDNGIKATTKTATYLK